MNHINTFGTCCLAITVTAMTTAATRADRPIPIGTSVMRISYPTASGVADFSGVSDYSGLGPFDAQNFSGAANIGGFNADNILGRRTAAIANDRGVQSTGETLMRHGIYKVDASDQLDIDNPFFADLDPTGNITFRVENIQFDRPVSVLENTVLFHVLWDNDQVDGLGAGSAYDSPHNQHHADPFRNLASFVSPTGPFLDSPVANYAPLSGMTPTFTQVAPDTITVEFEFDYDLLQHFQDDGTGVPGGLPGPGGFLEPFHFHLEYLVTPEPSAALLLLAGTGIAVSGRRRRR